MQIRSLVLVYFAMEAKAVYYLYLFLVSVLRSDVLATTEPVDPGEAEVDFKRLENDFAVGNVSATTEVLELFENSTIPEGLVTPEISGPRSDAITEFRPSVHLGEIEESRPRNSGINPFNNPLHLKFENFLSVEPKAKNEASNIFDKKNTVSFNASPPDSEPNFFPSSSIANGNHYLPPASSNSPISFPETDLQSLFNHQTRNFPNNNFHNPSTLLPSPPSRPEFPDGATYFKDVHHQFDHPLPVRPEEVNLVAPFNEGHNFKYGNQPNLENYEEQSIFKVHPSEVQEITLPRNQRFPYQFYQEPMGHPAAFYDGNLEYLTEEQVVHSIPRERRVSPWKKIVHLIGTILPFGLLLASLSPNIIQIGNSTESSIPLSKLKNTNLPPEHKNLRMESDSTLNICEEKNICDIILAGGKPKSNLVQNILWNFVMRTPEEIAKDNGLRELFEAVKKRDCNLITC